MRDLSHGPPRPLRLVRPLLALAALLAAFPSGWAGALALGLGPLSPDDAILQRALPSDTLLYDRTGTVLLADLHLPGYRHYEQSLAEMGRYLPEATVAIEDSGYWREQGVDPVAVGRAAWYDLEAGTAAQGGSTITQQLVKLRLVGDEPGILRKLREADVAMRVSHAYTKGQILQSYLNSVSYGNEAHGAAAAARIYFHTDAARLDLAQASLLAGLPRDPSLLDPLAHWPAARARQRQVLDAMVRTGSILPEEADWAYAEDLLPPDHLFGPETPNLAPGFVEWVSSEVALRYGPAAVRQGGLRVTTTLDWGLQQLAQRVVTDGVRANQGHDVSDGALAAVDPRTGDVLAMVGSAGPDVPGGQINLAVWPPRNPGSSFKIFTYTAAIESARFTMLTRLEDQPITVSVPGSPPYSPVNGDGSFHGSCELRACLGNSFNVPAVQVELATGIPNVVTTARAMGAPPYQQHEGRYSADDPPESYGPSLTLGGYGETPLQMATGAAVLADAGVLHRPTGIREVARPGAPPEATSHDGSRVVDAASAYIMGQMLADDANRSFTFGRDGPLVLPGRHVAAKTGTTDRWTDGWTVGYTPSLAAALWVGNADGHPMGPNSDGSRVAAPAWHVFMQAALDGMGVGDEWADPPAGVVAQQGAYFLAGTRP